MRCLTFNMCQVPLLTRHNKERLEAAAQYAASLNPDIIALQEVPLRNMIRALQRSLKGYKCLSGHHRYAFGGGLVVFSKLPVLSSWFVPYISQGPIFPPVLFDRILGKGWLHIMTKNLHFFNTHIIDVVFPCKATGFVNSQREQIHELLDKVSGTGFRARSIILAGDFNIPSCGDSVLGAFSKAGFRCAYPYGPGEESWSGRRSVFRFPLSALFHGQGASDQIWIRDGTEQAIRVCNAQFHLGDKMVTLPCGAESYLSDHRMLVVDFEIESPRK